MKARPYVLVVFALGGVLVNPSFLSAQGVSVLPGQADISRRPLPASPVNSGLPISPSATAQPQAQQALSGAVPQELNTSLTTLQAQLRYALSVIASYNGQAQGAPSSPAPATGSNLSSQTATNVSGRSAENLGVNVSAPPVNSVPQSAPLMAPATGPSSSLPGPAQVRDAGAGAPTASSQRLLALQQQMQVLLAQIEEVALDLRLADGTTSGVSATNLPAGTVASPPLTPTGRVPSATGRPQPPRNLRFN